MHFQVGQSRHFILEEESEAYALISWARNESRLGAYAVYRLVIGRIAGNDGVAIAVVIRVKIIVLDVLLRLHDRERSPGFEPCYKITVDLQVDPCCISR